MNAFSFTGSIMGVLVMASCTAPTPTPTPTPLPIPTPSAKINIDGPDSASVGSYINLRIEGLSQSDLSNAKLIWWPRTDLEVLPVQTWAGEPLLLVRATKANLYLLQIMTAKNNQLMYVEHQINFNGDTPTPDPTPDPRPDPRPDPTPGPTPPTPTTEPFAVLFIEETDSRTQDEAQAVLSETVINFIKERGWHRFLLDKDIKDAEGRTPESVKSYIERGVAKGLPWMIIIDKSGEIIYEGTIVNLSGVMEVLKKF